MTNGIAPAGLSFLAKDVRVAVEEPDRVLTD
jgi:hypothetical protein